MLCYVMHLTAIRLHNHSQRIVCSLQGTTKLDRWRPRLLYLFGLLGRHGAVILAEGAAEVSNKIYSAELCRTAQVVTVVFCPTSSILIFHPWYLDHKTHADAFFNLQGLCPSAEDVADLMMGWYKAPQADMKTRESALQASIHILASTETQHACYTGLCAPSQANALRIANAVNSHHCMQV